jgi:excisionase family DNA binding protein
MVASPDGKLLFTLNEAARALSISPSLLRRMTKTGAIPIVRMGTALRYDPDALRVFIKTASAQPYQACPSLSSIV